MIVIRSKILKNCLISTVAVSGISVALSAPANAQALPSVVDVCTGVSLPRSAVTDLIGDVVVPVVSPVQNTVNGVLTIVDPLTLGILPAPLNIDVNTILSNAAAGAPISLQVLDTNGTVVGASDQCNLTSDGYTLNTEQGISIGGNTITGLGTDGQSATAGELDAIAFGNNAATAVGATGAIALGTGASATAANSVALGTGSVADRGALAGYTAPGLTGTYNSVGSVSVGSAGNLRQITNVAPGTEATDAATVGQVQGALDAVAALGASAVEYDDATLGSVTLGGAGGTTVTNLAPGALSTTSTDAVNGSQLYTTNQQVAANTAGIAANAGDIGSLRGDVGTLQTDVGANTTDIAALQSDAVQYGDATHAAITFNGAGGTTLSGVAPGALSATSTEAVNGSQLYTTNQQVTANTADVAANTAHIATNTSDIAGNTSEIAALQSTGVQYDDATKASLTLGGASGTTVTNVAAGSLSAASTDAVNGSQLYATNQQVAANTAGIATNTADIAGLQSDVATNTSDITGLDGRVTTNETNIAALQSNVSALGSSAVRYDDASHAAITLDGAAGTTIAGVAAGTLDASSTQAVNGSQLYATNQNVAANTTDIGTLGTRMTTAEGNIAGLDGRVTTNETDITNLDARTTTNEGDIANLQGHVTTIDGRVTTNESNIATLQQQAANVPVRFVSDADRTTPSTTPTNTAALVSASGGATTLTNVAAGTLSASSTDAVNGSQLYATNQQVTQNTTSIQNISNNLAGSTVVAVQYSNPDTPTQSNGGTVTNDVALVGADPAAPVALHNVGNAALANDAVNLGQMQSGLADAMASAREYTDQRTTELAGMIDNVNFDLNKARKDSFAGTASAMAVAAIPQTMDAGRLMIGGGTAFYRGQGAWAIGLSSTFNDGQGVIKVGGTLDSRGSGGLSAGAGFSF